MATTRPNFVMTDTDLGLPAITRRDVGRRLNGMPFSAVIFTLSKISLFSASNMHSGLVENLGKISAFMDQATFENFKARVDEGKVGHVFRYGAILAAATLAARYCTGSRRLDLVDDEPERLGRVLFALNRLIGAESHRYVKFMPPPTAKRHWLGHIQAMLLETHPNMPEKAFAVGAGILLRIVNHPTFGKVDVAMRVAYGFGLLELHVGLSRWVGNTLSYEITTPHLVRLAARGQTAKVVRIIRAVTYAVGIRRTELAKLSTSSLVSPASARLVQTPIALYGGTAMCIDPLSLAELAGPRFGDLVVQLLERAPTKASASLTGTWRQLWRKLGFESYVADLLSLSSDAVDRPAEKDKKVCDVVARLSKDVLFAECKMIFLTPSTRRLRDSSRVADTVELAYRGGDSDSRGIPQSLATMKDVATKRRQLPNVQATGDDVWWCVIVTAEPVACSQEWRLRWSELANGVAYRVRTKPFLGPIFLSPLELALLAEVEDNTERRAKLLHEWIAGSELSFGNFLASRNLMRLPARFAKDSERLLELLASAVPE